jgi:hypothetical protein
VRADGMQPASKTCGALLAALLFGGSCSLLWHVRQEDLRAWEGAPKSDLQTHPLWSTIPRRVERLDDGSEMWTYSNCVSRQDPVSCSTVGSSTTCNGGGTSTACCYNQFLVQGNRVLSYRAIGQCYTDCSTRPASRQCRP